MTDKQFKLLVFAIIFSGVFIGLGLLFSGGIYDTSHFKDNLFLKHNRFTGHSWVILFNAHSKDLIETFTRKFILDEGNKSPIYNEFKQREK